MKYFLALITCFSLLFALISFNKKDKEVGTGLVGAPACGDVMKLQIKVNENGVIENAVFKVI
jgi:NifU-like protein involved in Fe-S cluster formation